MFNFVSVTSAFLGYLIAVAAVICFKHIHAAYENKRNQKKIERMKEAARVEFIKAKSEVTTAPRDLQQALADAARGKRICEVLEIPPKPGALQSGQKVESSTRGRGVVVGFSSISSEPLIYFYQSQSVVCVSSETLARAVETAH